MMDFSSLQLGRAISRSGNLARLSATNNGKSLSKIHLPEDRRELYQNYYTQ